jgi:hypothetical protein
MAFNKDSFLQTIFEITAPINMSLLKAFPLEFFSSWQSFSDPLVESEYTLYGTYTTIVDHLCGLVVRVPGYRSRGLGSIPGVTTFSEK